MIRFPYRSTMRARVGDPTGDFVVDWSFAREDATVCAFPVSFGSSRHDPEQFDLGGIGEVREHRPGRALTTVPGFLHGQHVCGTLEQWAEGWAAGTPAPSWSGGVPVCCLDGLEAAFTSGYDFGYES